MALSSPSLISTNPLLQKPAIPTTGPASAQPGTPNGQPPINSTTPADQFTASATASASPEQAPTAIGPKPNAPAIRFGNEHAEKPAKEHGFLRRTAATVLSVASGLSLLAAVPLALLQFAVGLIVHPLLITGAITLGLPILGLVGGHFLDKK